MLLGWLKWLIGWEDDPGPPERWDLSSLSDEESERYKTLLLNDKVYAHMDWDEFREYIREQGLPPPPPPRYRRRLVP